MRLSSLRGRRRFGAIAAFTALLVLPGSALGVVQLFTDVPPTNTFFSDIQAIAYAGITTGCGGGNFCPSANITRGQEAAFAHRGLPRLAMTTTPLTSTIAAFALTDIASVTITVPGTNGLGIGANQFVWVHGSAVVYGDATAAGCPCDYGLYMSTDGGGLVSVGYDTMVAGTGAQTTVAGQYVWAATPGTHTYTLTIIMANSAALSVFDPLELVAETAPFGSTGTDTLGPTRAGADTVTRAEAKASLTK